MRLPSARERELTTEELDVYLDTRLFPEHEYGKLEAVFRSYGGPEYARVELGKHLFDRGNYIHAPEYSRTWDAAGRALEVCRAHGLSVALKSAGDTWAFFVDNVAWCVDDTGPAAVAYGLRAYFSNCEEVWQDRLSW